MTTLYRPVKITSAEQADAMPVGTVVTGTRHGVIEKAGRRRWWAGLIELPDHIAVGGTALVPIEAEEETRLHIVRSGARTTTADLTRLVTPWEETP